MGLGSLVKGDSETVEAKLASELTSEQLTEIIKSAINRGYSSIRAEVAPDGKVRIHLIYSMTRSAS